MELNHDNLLQLTSEKDRKITLRIGVYKGMPSFTVWAGQGGGPTMKFNLPKDFQSVFLYYLGKLKTGSANDNYTIQTTTWEAQSDGTRKQVDAGSITFGIDAEGKAYIGIAKDGAKHKFLIRNSLQFKLDLPPKEQMLLAIDTLIRYIDQYMTTAIVVTSEKRQFGQGGNRSGGGGGGFGSGGGGFGGGNNRRENEVIDDGVQF